MKSIVLTIMNNKSLNIKKEISFIPDLSYRTLIGFRAENDAKTDEYFDKFKYANQDIIKIQGEHFFITLDDTCVKKIYNPEKINKLFVFDQYILADNAAGWLIKTHQPAILKNVRWNEKSTLPEEYRVIYLDMFPF